MQNTQVKNAPQNRRPLAHKKPVQPVKSESAILIRKCIAEFIGTLCLVFVGCGTAMLVGCDVSGGYLLTALAFGLAIVAMAYSIGGVSGCHINPAVSLAFWIRGELSAEEFAAYCASQVAGAFAGTGLLCLIFSKGGITDMTGALGANSLAGVNGSAFAGIIVEIILTFFFVLCILGVTSKKRTCSAISGLVIALVLTLVHIIGIGLTGTSVNPARSIAPAVISYIAGTSMVITQLYVFILAPMLGATLAACVYTYFED